AAMSLAQIGEFSFIIADVGLSSGATRPFLYPLAVTVSAATALLTPWLIRASDPVATYIDRRLPKPVQTLSALFRPWVEPLRTRARTPTVGRRIRHLGYWLLLDAALLAAIVIAAVLWGAEVAGVVSAKAPFVARFAWLTVTLVAAALATPLCIGIGRC